jgi:peptidyl-prolyl cis-trans isomerase A (cyclophilin A)
VSEKAHGEEGTVMKVMVKSPEVTTDYTARKFGGSIGAAVLALLLLMCPSAQAQAQSQKPVQPKAPVQPNVAPPAGQSATPKRPTTPARAYDRALLNPALLKAKAPDEYKVKFTTTRGDFTVTVHRAWAPIGADRFYTLVRHHFYDNATFFRVLPGFVVQFGISAYPPVSAAWTKSNIKDDPVTQTNLRGSLTFATAGPNTRTTQVFINLADNKRLDSMGFAPFAQVTEGMNVVEMMYEGYGEGAPQGAGPDQAQLEKQGKPYLDKGWPKLDYIKTAVLLTPPGATATGSKPAPAVKKP